jgi:alcohol dehydrogenase
MNGNGQQVVFDLPTSWRHRRGLASEIGTIVHQFGCRKPLLLTDKMLSSLGILEPIITSLKREGIHFTICDEVEMEPTVAHFAALVNQLDMSSFDSIIAVGGGSVLDVAKGLSIIGTFGGDIRDYAGFDKVPGVPNLKVFAIPTTSGTGSEVSDGVALIDEERDTKFLVISKKICPSIALTDPELTISMPPNVTACSGIDALVHAVESYVSKRANMATELFSLKAITLLCKGLKPAWINGRDLDARETMQIGATMAMIAAMNSYLGLCHAMAMPLCGIYKMRHGQACGMLLPHVLKYNSVATPAKVLDIFRAMGIVAADEPQPSLTDHLYNKIGSFVSEVGISVRLNDFGYRDSHLDIIVKATMQSAQRPTNPRDPTEQDIVDIVKRII